MTKLDIMNLIKEKLNDASWHYDFCLEKYDDESNEVARSQGIYHALIWLLDDIKEKELEKELNQ